MNTKQEIVSGFGLAVVIAIMGYPLRTTWCAFRLATRNRSDSAGNAKTGYSGMDLHHGTVQRESVSTSLMAGFRLLAFTLVSVIPGVAADPVAGITPHQNRRTKDAGAPLLAHPGGSERVDRVEFLQCFCVVYCEVSAG